MTGPSFIATAFLAAMLVTSLPAAASATDACGGRNELIQKLGAEYAEVPTATGLAANGLVWEVLTSPSGTWTILITDPRGQSCLIAAGEAWSEAMAASTTGGGPEL